MKLTTEHLEKQSLIDNPDSVTARMLSASVVERVQETA